jgi:two-component system, response regulator YesN
MLRILIVDDDKIIRKGLRTIIENDTLDFKVIGEATNGLRALEKIEEMNPDILITDIKMPVMDGIELINNITKKNIKLKTIVLSGYDDYKYVRETLKNGAVDYILKPVENKELIDLLKHLKNKIEEEKVQEENLHMYSRKISESVFLLKEKFLSSLLKDSKAGELSTKSLNEFNITQIGECVLSVIGIDDYYKLNSDSSIEELKQETVIKDIIQFIFEEELIKERDIQLLICQHEREIVILFVSPVNYAKEFIEYINRLLNNIRQRIFLNRRFTITVGNSKPFEDIVQTSTAYTQASQALSLRFYEQKNKIIWYNEEQLKYETFTKNMREMEEKIIRLVGYVQLGNSEKAKGEMENIFEIIGQVRIEPVEFKKILSNIIWSIKLAVPEFKEIIENDKTMKFNVLSYIDDIDTLKELKNRAPEEILSVTKEINLIRKGKSKKLIESAKDYIRSNYKEEISLKSVSEHIFINPNYLSELFKEETGTNFVDYLIETRINAAKKLLLKPGIKIYEVGQMVGYNEPESFTRAFKKVIGVSPNEYKNIVK